MDGMTEEIWTYHGILSVTISGDQRAKYWPGQKLQITQSDGTKFFRIETVDYIEPNTIVTLDGLGLYLLIDSDILGHQRSIIGSPQGYPAQPRILKIGSLYQANYNYPGSAYLVLDRETDEDDCSIVFRTQGSARAEFGLVSDGDYHFKTVFGEYPNETFVDRLLVRASGAVDAFGSLLRAYGTSGVHSVVAGNSDRSEGAGLELTYDQDNTQAYITSVEHGNCYRNLNICGQNVLFHTGALTLSQILSLESSGDAIFAGDISAPSVSVNNYVDFNEVSSPSTPDLGSGRLYYKSDHKFYYRDDSGVEKEMGSGSSDSTTLINYILNPDAYIDTFGWSTYADAASVDPIDGTGGSPNVTWTRSTSSPLRGVASFLLTKDAENRQGQGVSYDFVIDRADAASMLKISFDWESSVTLSEGDIRVWIYDKDNSRLINVVPYKLPSATSNVVCHWQGEFQTSPLSATNYRLIIHIASTSTTAWGIKFDNFSVAPNPIKQGVPVTDWVNWTPTGSWTSNVTYTGKWRRVGDVGEYRIRIVCSGAPNSAELTINLPNGHVIDTSKILDTTHQVIPLGLADVNDYGVQKYLALVKYVASTTAVGIVVHAKSGTYLESNAAVTQAIPITFGTNDTINATFRVPIAGWSSNCQMSEDAETRVVSAHLQRNTNLSLTASTQNTFVCNSVITDTHNAYNTSTGLYTVKVPGYYVATCVIRTTSSSWAGTNEIGMGFVKNSESEIKMGVKFFDANVTSVVSVMGSSPPVLCNAGDTLKVQIFTSQNCTLDGSSYPSQNWIGIYRLSGPSQIAASEKIATTAELSGTMNLAPNGSAVKINLNTPALDTHGCFNTGTYKWTCPRGGYYKVDFGVSLRNTNILNSRYFISLYKNGSEVRRGNDITPSANSYLILTGSTVLNLVAGDYLEVYLYGAGNNSTNQLVAEYGPGGCYLCVSSV